MSARRMWYLVFALGAATNVLAAIWNVSTGGSDETGDGSENFPFATIQFGIDTSQSSDTVLVQPGTYIENINYDGKNIVVGSMTLTAGDTSFISQTIIDGNQAASVVTFSSGEGNNAKLVGFTIANGMSIGNGGGINCYSASPQILNCRIIHNAASNWGGGLCFDQNAQALISNCVIDSNTAGYGGGIFCEVNSDIVITDVIIRANVANNLGGGFYCTEANPLFNRALVEGNSAPAWAGVYIHGTEFTETFLNNVTIVGNYADGGGGLIVSSPSTILTVNNCIIWDNSPNQVQVEGGGLVLTINYSDIQNGWEGQGNIDENPLFVDAENYDYNLNNNSPCIDTGNPDFPQDPDGTRMDMGAYYYHQALAYEGPIWHVSIGGSDVDGDGSASNPFGTVQRAEGSASENDTIQLADGVFEDSFLIQNKSLVIRGIDSTVTEIAADHIYCQTNAESHSVRFENLRFESIVTNSHTMIWSECTNCTENDSINVEFVNVYGDGSGEKSFMAASTRSLVEVYNSQFHNFSRGNNGGVFDLERENGNSGLSIINSEFFDNSADRGGSIHIENGNSLSVIGSRFKDNSSTDNLAGGGAVALEPECEAFISATLFEGNQTSGNGGAIYSLTSHLVLDHCSFRGNSGSGDGQVLYATSGSSVEITFSSFSGNGSTPGSIALSNGSALDLSNSILWGTPNFQLVILDEGNPCTADITYCDFSNGVLGIEDQSGDLSLNWGVGNFSQNPLFTSETDLNLLADSPCIDAGNPDRDGDGTSWELDPDDQDPDGTRLDIGAFSYDQRDTIPPAVILNDLDIGGRLFNGDTLTISWSTTDNSILDWAKLFFTSDGGASFSLADSVDAELGELDWIAPDIISDSCNFAIRVSDLAGNIAADTLTGFFSIADGTAPTVVILHPATGTSVREGDTLRVAWDARDNTGIELQELHFSNNPADNYPFHSLLEAGDSTFFLPVGRGVSDSARVKLIVTDGGGNATEEVSDYFSITDNTPPQVSILQPTDPGAYPLAASLDIRVLASDNVAVTALDLKYSADGGIDWLPIALGLVPNSDTLVYDWVIPNIPGPCQIQAVAHDAAGLITTDTSAGFTVTIEYPLVLPSSNRIWPTDEIVLHFSQNILNENLPDAVRVTGSVDDPYEIGLTSSAALLRIKANNGFRSLDILTIVIYAEELTNIHGYGLDGNANGIFEGSPIDNDTLQYFVAAAGDYSEDGQFNFDDFAVFVSAWYADEYRYELAPNRDEIPNITIQSDSLFDIRDLATFAAMWNWSAGISLSAPLTGHFQYEEIVSEQVGNRLTVTLPVDEYTASQTIIKYDPGLLSVSLADPGLARVSSRGLSFVDVDPDSGFILITRSQAEASSENALELKLEPMTRQRYSIEVAFQGADDHGMISQTRSMLELLPIPTSFSLSQNYPNPFNASTTIEYGLPQASDISISIYDIRGRFVKDIYSGEKLAGYHVMQWNGSVQDGQTAASGIYFIVLSSPEYRTAVKALLLK